MKKIFLLALLSLILLAPQAMGYTATAWCTYGTHYATTLHFQLPYNGVVPDSVIVLARQYENDFVYAPRFTSKIGWRFPTGYEGAVVPAPGDTKLEFTAGPFSYFNVKYPVAFKYQVNGGAWQSVIADNTSGAPVLESLVVEYSGLSSSIDTDGSMMISLTAVANSSAYPAIKIYEVDEDGARIGSPLGDWVATFSESFGTTVNLTCDTNLASVGKRYEVQAQVKETTFAHYTTEWAFVGYIDTGTASSFTVTVSSPSVTTLCPGIPFFMQHFTTNIEGYPEVHWRESGDSEWVGDVASEDSALEHVVPCPHYQSCEASDGTAYDVQARIKLRGTETWSSWIDLPSFQF